jgi:hypothetical protein
MDEIIDMLRAGSSPEAQQAQNILFRRLALEGDVNPSRVPPPRNISEVGGYLNLLAGLHQPEMRAQMLAGVLGVAGPNPPLGWLTSDPVLSIASLANDRPDGASQPVTPLAFSIRSDFVPAFERALQVLHDQGAMLPLLAPLAALPLAVSGATAPDDALPFLGRVITIVPSAALRDPATDPIALIRAQGSTDPYRTAARVLSPGAVVVPTANVDALQCTAALCTPVQRTDAFVSLPPVMATAGFYPSDPPPQPANDSDFRWARFTNITGLVPGLTRLGDELALLYSMSAVGTSVFADRQHWVWNGSQFAKP